MEITKELLQEIQYQYLKQPERILLPARQIGARRLEHRARASRLHGCAVADQFARNQVEHTHPHLPSLLHRFELGNRVGQIWQEAAMWAALNKVLIKHADYEVSLENESLVGQVDLLVEDIPCEIKHTVRWEPYDGHVRQIRAYMMMLDAPYGMLIYQKDYDCLIWRVERDDKEVMDAVSALNQYSALPSSTDEIIPGVCVNETDPGKIFPHEALRSNAASGVRKGDMVEGKSTVKCPYFGHCFPGVSDSSYNVRLPPEP